MSLRIPRLPALLQPEDLSAMHAGALMLLDEVGLQIDATLAPRLAVQDGVRLSGDRAYLSPWLVEQHLAEHRAASAAHPAEPEGSVRPAPGRIHLSAGCCSHHVVDLETDAVRPITSADLVQATRLIDTLHDEAVSGHTPGFPQDVPPDLQALAEYKIGCQNTRWGGSATAPASLACLEHLYEMQTIMGHPFGLPLYVVSPLRIVGESLQAILHFAGRVQRLSASSMPVMGGNAPVHFAAAFTQAIAESLGGWLVLRLIAPGVPVSFGMMAFCLDMHYGSIVYGSPEQNLCDLIGLSLRAFYGLGQGGTRSIRSMAKRPGVQASAEKAASAMAGALAGSTSFFGAGTLSVDEVFSPEQLVIDREIADSAGRMAQGVAFDETTLALEAVRDCARSGEFLSHPSTVHGFRDVYWRPRLMDHPMLAAWQAAGETDTRVRARSIVRDRLSRFSYELPAEKARALDKIYSHACEALR